MRTSPYTRRIFHSRIMKHSLVREIRRPLGDEKADRSPTWQAWAIRGAIMGLLFLLGVLFLGVATLAYSIPVIAMQWVPMSRCGISTWRLGSGSCGEGHSEGTG